ncbi:uncharacterized protein LOC141643592 [Silene latifolia]|uniref:uncharacterized protein LOC141643592 n=1 Tax=Silene latifolia TaxID=37657 RepID=UPI003D785AD6
MEGKRAVSTIWLVVLVAVIVVATNVEMCYASVDELTLDKMKESAEEAKDNWGDWLNNKISGSEKEGVDTEDVKKGAEDMMNKAKDSASDASRYVSDKVEAAKESDTMSDAKGTASDLYEGAKDKAEGMFDWAKQKFGEAYGSVTEKTSDTS